MCSTANVVVDIESYKGNVASMVGKESQWDPNDPSGLSGVFGYFIDPVKNYHVLGKLGMKFTERNNNYNYNSLNPQLVVKKGFGFNEHRQYVEGGKFHMNSGGEITRTKPGYCYINGKYVLDEGGVGIFDKRLENPCVSAVNTI